MRSVNQRDGAHIEQFHASSYLVTGNVPARYDCVSYRSVIYVRWMRHFH